MPLTQLAAATAPGADPLEGLRQREEILQICYWYQGEGLGASFTPLSVIGFLQTDPASVDAAFEALAREGDLRRGERGFEFTPEGKRRAARMFVEEFTDFQQPGHGECVDGCCEGDEPCNADHTNCDHLRWLASRAAGRLVCD
ncbi:MAG: hypothetical protein NVSMB18_30260 [Acetobacteraceae bacterium]